MSAVLLTPWEREEMLRDRIDNAKFMARHFRFLKEGYQRMAKRHGYASEWHALTEKAQDAEDAERKWDQEVKRLEGK